MYEMKLYHYTYFNYVLQDNGLHKNRRGKNIELVLIKIEFLYLEEYPSFSER
jgi:hypothetical protein